MLTPIFILAGFIFQNHNTVGHVNHSKVRVPRQTVAQGCYLPPHPTNGQWIIYDRIANSLPSGRLVKASTVLKITCQHHYKLDGVEFATCIDREWKPNIGRCLRTCPTLSDAFTMTVSCTYNEKITSCVDALEGTIARFQCSRFYEDRRQTQALRFCSNGTWGTLPECVPVCGRRFGEEPTLIIGGKTAEKGEYPWQIALYTVNDKILICGGTLLNQRVIITAAHCVTDLDGELLPKDSYMVVAGKYYRQFNDSRDANEMQFSSISEMFTPVQYQGDLQNYFGDIAVLVTEKPFIMSKNVQPICIDWGFTRYNIFQNASNLAFGYVAGWGFTIEYKQPSNVLKVLQVPFITEQECRKGLSEDDRKFLTADKLCAGFLNTSTSVCKGDSGGGLVYESQGRFHLLAVVSLSPQAKTRAGGCDSQQYTLYTNISYYAESFIFEKETKYRNSGFRETTTPKVDIIQERNCVLPPYPQFGRWRFLDSENFFPGMSVVPETILRITCDKGFKLESNETVICDSGKWSSEIGHCLRKCPAIKESKHMNVTCIHHNEKQANCREAVDGTVAKFQCAPFYEDSILKTRPFVVCRDGFWDQTLPMCLQVCGKKSNDESGIYPWHVGIYSARDKELICSGSLLRENIVLTAAHCVTNGTVNPLPKENYVVAIGKKHKLFNDSQDPDAQFSEVQDITVSKDFVMHKGNYAGDVATLVLQKPFILSDKVTPVCLDWGETAVSAEKRFDGVGEVPGWRPASSSNSAQVVKQIKISTSRCKVAKAQELTDVRMFDQKCAETVDKGPSVCKGDGGAGVVYERQGRYYIRGIVSFPSGLQSSNSCDSPPYALYTKVFNYLTDFILTSFAKYKI